MIAAAELRSGRPQSMVSPPAPKQVFLGVSVLLFAASATLTALWCGSMSGTPTMRMPGGWAMSMTWMRMPGQTWLGAGASFAGMWAVMMTAMMMPSLVPMLQRYRDAVGRAGDARLGRLTATAGFGYYLVWSALGVALFPAGATLAWIEMRFPSISRAVPAAAGAIVVSASALQFTRWKMHHLACCRGEHGCYRTLPADGGAGWRHGLQLGANCSYCCANWTAVLLVMGAMDLRAMAVVTAAITAERLAPDGARVARALGVAGVGIGLLLMARAAGI